MKRKPSPPPIAVAADRRQRKKSRRCWTSTAAGDTDLLLLFTNHNPVPHLLVTEVFYTPPSHNPCAFNRRGAIISVPLDGDVVTAASYTSAPIRRRGRLADFHRRCMSFLGATPRGRLAFAGSRGVFLVNPVTDALQGFNTMGYCQNAVLAAGGGSGGGCGIFVSLGAVLAPPALWRLDDDDGERWSECPLAATGEQTGDVVAAVSSGKGCFYYLLHGDGSVSRVDAGEPPPLRMEKLPVARLVDHFVSPPRGASLAGEGHLLECDGEVLFVRKLLAVREIAAPFCAHGEFVGVVGFEVYRLDVAARRWDKVERLPGGDTAIFVSPESAFAVRAQETAAAAGMMGNCVYFVGESRCCLACGVYGGSTWGAYSMKDREVLFEHAVESRGGRMEALWFLPSVV
ncbi:unnamed protein product [Urochloa decumbens]|uniref:KIB1-4 beta-propeller domain-containing protein n=1 Tax=Urochloa decumbens TaxID=240449 RepID=A0ABC9EL56_9POAL